MKLFLILGVFYPLLRIELITHTGLPSPVLGAWLDLVSMALGFTIIFHGWMRGGCHLVKYAVWCVITVGILGIMFGSDLIQIIYGLRQTYLPMVFFLVGLRFGLVWAHTERLWNLLIVVLAVSALSGIVLTFLFPEYWISLYMREEGNARDWGLWAISRESGLRMTGAILDPVVFGTLCAWGCILSFGAFFVAHYRKKFIVLAFVACLIGLIMSLSRGAWFGAALGLFIVTGLNPKRILSWHFGILVVSLAAIAAIVTNVDDVNTIFEVVSRTVDKTVSEGNAQREDQFIGVIKNLSVKPLGNGLGNAGHVGERFSTNGLTSDGYPHITDSWYLKLLAEGGGPLFIAFITYICTSFAALVRALIRCRESQRRGLLSALLAIQTMSILQAAVSNIWDLYYLSQLLWLLGGLAAAFRPMKKFGRLNKSCINQSKRDIQWTCQ